jgi:SAM-dependent methyltransferase
MARGFADYAAEQARAWGEGPVERLAQASVESHAFLVSRLAPRAGERLLDVATGAGGLALLAAAAGADATGIDLAPGLVEVARRAAAERGLAVRLDVGDAERLPYEDASFDVVASAFGVMFALDDEAAAGELARVTRPGGRIGLLTLRPSSAGAGMWRLLWRFDPRPEGAADPMDWGREEHVRELLGDAFDLSVEPVEAPPQPERDPQQVWEQWSASFGPARVLLERLDPERAAAFRDGYLEHLRAREPRLNLLVLGTRRST